MMRSEMWLRDIDGMAGTTRPELMVDPNTGEAMPKMTVEASAGSTVHDEAEPVEVEVPVLGKLMVKDVTQGNAISTGQALAWGAS